MKKTVIVTFILSILCQLAFAGGVTLTAKCSNENCKYTTQFKRGNGKVSKVVSGYCMGCKKMVTTHFKRGTSGVIAKVWDSKSGNILDLYSCPHCKKPFAEVKQMAFCPKCRQKTISTKRSGKWD